MLSVTIDEILRDPSKYLRQVEAGETFVILQAEKAIAELRPISSSKQLRPFGLTSQAKDLDSIEELEPICDEFLNFKNVAHSSNTILSVSRG
jgi:antitoxin (DNA-binding transcriptional repressor) of toxin-antitoxin stability system